jgi:sarcosine oxidase, subunit gamma
VIAEAIRRSALADYAERFTTLYETTEGSISIRELPFLAQLNLRVDAGDAAVMRQLTDSLGFSLPLTPNMSTQAGDRRALWLGPNEWLIVGPDDQATSLEQALRDGLAGAFGSIVDVSANRTVLEIRGARARDLLAHGVPIDLDPRSFRTNQCAQTLLAKAQVIIERRGEEAAFHLYVRSSFAGYAAEWLLDAAATAQ